MSYEGFSLDVGFFFQIHNYAWGSSKQDDAFTY